jgi:hypothetical protein
MNQIFNEKLFTMSTKKLFFGICTCLILMAAALTPDNTIEDQLLHKDGVDKTKIIIK